MAKTKGQKAKTEQVQQRLTGEAPSGLVVQGEAQIAGKKGESTSRTVSVTGGATSYEGAQELLRGNGLNRGVVITNSGMEIPVSRGKSGGADRPYVPHAEGLAPQRASEPLPKIREGVSQTITTSVRRQGRTAAQLVAEADKVAANRPVPVSAGVIERVMQAAQPSMGGNRRTPGAVSRHAKKGPREQAQALNSLGYTADVQNRMYEVSKGRIANSPTGNQLSPAEINSRAYEQVNEHLDEALHGTKSVEHSEAVAREAISHPGMGLVTAAGSASRAQAKQARAAVSDPWEMKAGRMPTGPEVQESAGTTPMRAGREKTQRGLGMTPSRSPEVQAMHNALQEVVTSSNPRAPRTRSERRKRLNVLKAGGGPMLTAGSNFQINASDLDAALASDAEERRLRQKARRTSDVPPEEQNTMSRGVDPERKARAKAQLVFSTSNPGIGVAPDVAAGRKRPGRVSVNQTLAPGAANNIAIPPNLPTEPAKIGRTREERGIRPSSFPTGSEPVVAAKPGKKAPPKPKGRGSSSGLAIDQGAPGGRWSPSQGLAAQTEQPRQFAGTGLDVGLHQARAQNVQLGQRAASGPRMAYKG